MIKTVGLVLKKQNIGETDRILTVFSPVIGKKRVIARAIRKPLSKLAGHLDTFMLSQLMLTDEADLPKVTSAVVIEPFEEIRQTLIKVERSYAIVRLVESVIVEDMPQQTLFRLTVDALSRIANEENWSATWLFFLSELARTLGVGVETIECARCGKPLAGQGRWLPDERVLYCHDCLAGQRAGVELDANTVKLLYLLKKRSFDYLSQIRIPQSNSRQLEELFLREVASSLHKPWHHYSGLAKSLG